MTTTTSTKTPPPPAYDAVAAISSKTTTTTTTTPDEFAKTNRITKDDTADYDDVDSLASLTTRELHRIAISNGDRLGEGPKESTTGGGGGGGAAAAGNFETNEGGVGLSEAEEKDAKIALCEVRNPKKIGQGNATTTTKKKFTTTTTTTTTTNVFLSSVKRHVLRASVFDFDATLCGLLLLLLLLLTNNCVLLLLLLNRLNRVRGVYRQIGMYVSLVQQSERGSRTTIL